MKKSILLFLSSLIILGFNSCDKAKEKIDELTEFDIALPTASADLPAATFTAPSVNLNQAIVINTPEIPTNSSSEYSKNKTTFDLVSEIKMVKLNVKTDGNLDFMKSIEVFIKAGSDEKRIAKKDVIPAGTADLALDLDDVNIKDYISKEKISFKISVMPDANKLPKTAQTLKIDGTAHVKATLIK